MADLGWLAEAHEHLTQPVTWRYVRPRRYGRHRRREQVSKRVGRNVTQKNESTKGGTVYALNTTPNMWERWTLKKLMSRNVSGARTPGTTNATSE